ncbi:hypothetical protein D0864_03981 [Hortaea werneckii]|uniref:Phosphatidylinositol-specific phospholipase C X domain-containing protein n=1 Tax=Hortaea werneckii TaxID=91943 RepID=A0A3M7GFI0_HORWE|nr:hypothetical protein D0864_03981 [Hortaea werneckii]
MPSIACYKPATRVRLASSLADGKPLPSRNTVQIFDGEIGFPHTCTPPGDCSIGSLASFNVAETMFSTDKKTGCRTRRFNQRSAVSKSSNYKFLFAAFILLLLFSRHYASFMGNSLAAGLSHATCTHSPALHLNHIQVVGTHNSYHREISLKERAVFEQIMPSPENLYYSHASLEDQLSHQAVRSLEIDLHSDTKGGLYGDPLIWRLSNLTNATAPFYDPNFFKPGLKVFHVTDADVNAVCHTFVECLQQLKHWSDNNPTHLPILIDLELKCDAPYCAFGGLCAEEAVNWTLPRILEVDREIRSIMPASKLVTPDDVRQANTTLEQSVLQHGWPKLDDVRGRFMFFFDNDPDNDSACTAIRSIYRSNGHESLQDRVVFTNSIEGDSDAAFIKYNNPTKGGLAEIQRLVKKGYIVRTRADTPITTVLEKDLSMYNASWPSGAQIC